MEGSAPRALTENAPQIAPQNATASAIAYVIEQAFLDGAYTHISTEYGSAEQSKLHQLFIELIANDMYEFCSAKYGHDISIKSYDEYCYHYAETHGILRYAPLYMMRYFINGIWKVWNPLTYDVEIYKAYTKKINTS